MVAPNRVGDEDDVEIVKLSRDEWRAFKTLRLRALKQDPPALAESYEGAVTQPDEYWQGRLQHASEGTRSWLWFARHKGGLVGMVGAFVDPGGGDARLANVVAVYVDAAFRRRGSGRELLTALIDEVEACGVRQLRLAVNETQRAAVALYREVGFEVVQRRSQVMGDGQAYTEQLMRRELHR